MKAKIDTIIELHVLEHLSRPKMSGWRMAAHLWMMITQRETFRRAICGIFREVI